jgi:hydroxyethylthiazole kinase-like uncharacterized protein yjeF
MRILTSAEVRQAELEAIGRAGMSASALMLRAGYAVAQFCLSHFKFNSVCVVCGRDSNGGQGMAAAESLREIAESVSVLILAKDASELSEEAAAMCFRLSTEPIWIADEAGLEQRAVRDALTADLIVDAIAGTSFKPPLDKLAGKAVTAINDAFGTVVSVDVPSGIDADSNIPRYESSDDAVFAHGIITFIGPKPAHIFGELTSGPMAVSEIGVQPALVPNQIGLAVVTGQEVGITFPPRLPGAHKGQLCHVLMIAGSRGQAGAAGLAGMAVLRTGAGLAIVACPKSIEAVVSGFAPELLTASLEETSEGTISTEAGDQLESLMKGKDVVVLGPGLSANEETRRFVRRLVEHCSAPLVLDAGGVNAFEGHYDELKSTSGNFRVLTLQLAEAARLLGISISDTEANRTAVARRVSNEASSCVVLKGSRTVVAGLSGETWFNLTGGSALAKSGSDDVLSGMIGAALAQHARSQIKDDGDQRSPGNANQASAFLNDIRVAAAVHLHGLAGDMARDTLHENTILATDILESLTDAFRDCDLQMERRLFYLHK